MKAAGDEAAAPSRDGGSETLAERLTGAPRLPRGRAGALRSFLDGIEDEALRRRLGDVLTPKSLAARLAEAMLVHSPFLTRLAVSRPAWLLEALTDEPSRHLDGLLEAMRRGCAAATTDDEIMPVLRQARQRVALLVALADLGGVWPLADVTEALTRLADAAVSLAADHALREAHRGGKLMLADLANPGEGSFYVLIAMGKHGARELNYSSDVDLIALHHARRAPVAEGIERDALFARVTHHVVRLLQARTADDYVLRVDLRLRPDPSSTPPSVPLAAAYQYYESVGQDWERAAFIKARPVAGDVAMGSEFLAELAPFTWRRHLDFKAIAALRGLWREVRAVHGDDETISGRNVKLGPGGIRECELATQALQLVFGGRDPRLRGRRTLAMLKALAEAGHLPRDARKRLSAAYAFLRMVEHRLQMRHDEQTQMLPRDGDDLDDFALWCGFTGTKAFEKELAARTAEVRAEAEKAFGVREAGHDEAALVFTKQKLAAMGFRRPAETLRLVEGWTAPPKQVTARALRAREALTQILPDLVGAFAATDDPDAAVAAFDRTIDRMAAPSELFSILGESERLRHLFAALLGSAPRIAEAIVQRPHLIDSFMDVKALAEAQTPRRVEHRIAARVASASSYEEALDLMRDAGREEWFLAGAHFLGGGVDAQALGAAYTAVAEGSLRVALEVTEKAFAAEHGEVEGARLAVLAMGRLASREMTASSDLDLIVVYRLPAEAGASNGRRPLDPVLYFSRLTHRLITSVSTPTAHGRLYDIDMRLRPSGGKGPVALPLSAFVEYQQREAETWEHLALTRARPVAGDAALCRQLALVVRQVLAGEREPARLAREVKAMRKLLASEKGDDDVADLKQMRGGLVDIDFCAQFLILAHGSRHGALIAQSTAAVLEAAAAHGLLTAEEARRLLAARALFSELLQRERLHATEAQPANWNEPAILAVIARHLRFGSAAALKRAVETARSEVAEIHKRVLKV